MHAGTRTDGRPRRRIRLEPAVWILLALALACRLVAVELAAETMPTIDAADYERHAMSLSEGRGYPESTLAAGGGPSALRPPAYPYLLAGVYALTGGELVWTRILQAFLGTLTAGLIGLVARLIWGRRAALAALAVAALYPPLVLLGTALLSENLYLPLMLGALAAVLAARDSPHRYRWALLAGVLAGLSILTRQNGALLLLPLLLAVAAAGGGWRSRRALGPALALLAAAVVVVLPWTIRNAVVLERFVPVATQSGVLLSGTYNDDARGDRTFPAAWRPPSGVEAFALLFARRDLSEAELDAELRSRSTDYIVDHPLYPLRAGWWNALRLTHLGGGPLVDFTARDLNLTRAQVRASQAAFYLLALLALAGALTAAARQAPRWLWLAPLLLATLIFIAGLVRYRLPVDVFLVLLAGVGVAAGCDRLRPAARAAE